MDVSMMLLGSGGTLSTDLSSADEAVQAVASPDRTLEQLRVLQSILGQVVDGDLSLDEAAGQIRSAVPELAAFADWLWETTEAVADSKVLEAVGRMYLIVSIACSLHSCISGSKKQPGREVRLEIIRDTMEQEDGPTLNEPGMIDEETEIRLRESCLEELERRELKTNNDTSTSTPDSPE